MLQVVIGRQKSNFIGKFKLEPIIIQLPIICYESVVKNIVDVSLFFDNTFIFNCGWLQYYIYIYIYIKLTPQQL